MLQLSNCDYIYLTKGLCMQPKFDKLTFMPQINPLKPIYHDWDLSNEALHCINLHIKMAPKIGKVNMKSLVSVK